jgi:hypothetical protein
LLELSAEPGQGGYEQRTDESSKHCCPSDYTLRPKRKWLILLRNQAALSG